MIINAKQKKATEAAFFLCYRYINNVQLTAFAL